MGSLAGLPASGDPAAGDSNPALRRHPRGRACPTMPIPGWQVAQGDSRCVGSRFVRWMLSPPSAPPAHAWKLGVPPRRPGLQGRNPPLTGWFVNLWHSWYTGGVPAVRVMPHTVLSQHLPNGARTSMGRRDRPEPRRNPGAGPRLRTQVQILAAHGIVGRSCCRRWISSFAGILIPQPACSQALLESPAIPVPSP